MIYKYIFIVTVHEFYLFFCDTNMTNLLKPIDFFKLFLNPKDDYWFLNYENEIILNCTPCKLALINSHNFS